MSDRCSSPSLMYFSLSSMTMPDFLSALLMIILGALVRFWRAFISWGLRLGLFVFTLYISDLTLCR